MKWIVEFVMVDKKGKNITLTCNHVNEYPECINCTFDTHAMSYPITIIKSITQC